MKSLENDLVQSSSGKIGKMLVFRQRAGLTIIAKTPRSKKVPDSPGQVAVKDRFRRAVLYARNAIANPGLKLLYLQKAKPRQPAFNRAFSCPSG